MRLTGVFVTMLCAGSVAVALPSSAAVATVDPPDVVAPVISSLSISGTEFQPGDTVSLHWVGSDDQSQIWGIEVQWRTPTGLSDDVLVDYSVGPAPTQGDVDLTVPMDAPTGLYQVGSVTLWDASCNARTYSLDVFGPASATGGCETGPIFEGRVPDAISVAPLVFAVGMSLPPLTVPEEPSAVTARWVDDGWRVRWKSVNPYSDAPAVSFTDWQYRLQVADRSVYVWPETQWSVPPDVPLTGTQTVRVKTANRFGWSTWAKTSFNADPSGPVGHLTAVDRHPGALVRWDAPDVGDESVRYAVGLRPGDRAVCDAFALWKVASVTHTRFVLPRSDTRRTVGVVALDAEGQPSTCTSVVVPRG